LFLRNQDEFDTNYAVVKYTKITVKILVKIRILANHIGGLDVGRTLVLVCTTFSYLE